MECFVLALNPLFAVTCNGAFGYKCFDSRRQHLSRGLFVPLPASLLSLIHGYSVCHIINDSSLDDEASYVVFLRSAVVTCMQCGSNKCWFYYYSFDSSSIHYVFAALFDTCRREASGSDIPEVSSPVKAVL